MTTSKTRAVLREDNGTAYYWHDDVYKPWAGSRLLQVVPNVFYNKTVVEIKYEPQEGKHKVFFKHGFGHPENIYVKTIDIVDAKITELQALMAEQVAKRMEE